MKTLSKPKAVQGRNGRRGRNGLGGGRKLVTLAPTAVRRAAPVEELNEDEDFGEVHRGQGALSRRILPRVGAGFPPDLRATLAILSAQQAAIGQHSVRNRGMEVAKNELKGFVDEVLKAYEDPATRKISEEFYMEAYEAKRSGDNRKMTALLELRKDQINNFARARSHYLEMFYDEITLGQNDSAAIVNETMYPQAVMYMAQDGNLRMQRAIDAYTNWLVPLYFVTSQKYGYQIEDIQRGNITGPANASVDIAFDIAQQLDSYGYKAMTGSLPRSSQNGGVNGVFGAFTTSLTNPNTAPQLWTFNTHPAVQQGLLPTTNALTPYPDPIPAGLSQGRLPGMLVDGAGNPVVGFAVCHAIIKYCEQFANIFMDGPLRPTGLLIVPAIDASSVLSQVNATAAKPSAIAEGLLSNYTRFEFGNVVWTVMADVTIPRGTAYAVLNKPLGKNYTKPSFDREFVNTDFEANWETRQYRKTQGLYIPVQYTPRAVSVTYM